MRLKCSQPLGSFLEFSASTVKFDARCTALWRGYVGTWSIENDRLYLVKLRGYVDDAVNCEILEVGMEVMFSDYPDGVFACRRKHLVRLVSSDAVEADAKVIDPLGRAPDLPFGHLNAGWCHKVSSGAMHGCGYAKCGPSLFLSGIEHRRNSST